MKLRPYQEQAVYQAMKQLAKGEPGVITMATGGGKSLCIAAIAKQCPNALILQPSKELVEQNYGKLKQAFDGMDEHLGMFSSSVGCHDIERYTFATIGSVYRHAKDFKHFTTVLVDEAHRVDPTKGMYKKFLGAIDCGRVIGLTATPYRYVAKTKMDWQSGTVATSQMLVSLPSMGYFKDIITNVGTGDLTRQGYLSPLKYYRDPVGENYIQLLKLNSNGTEYTDDSLSYYGEVTAQHVAKLAEQAIQKKFWHKALVFASDVKSAERISNIMGAPIVTGTTPKKEREEIVREFRNTKRGVLVNVATMTTGVDFPDLDGILLARPTRSVTLYQQILGRGIRLDPNNPDKVCKVIDITGTTKSFGPIDELFMGKDLTDHWQLFGRTGQLTDQMGKVIYIKRRRKNDGSVYPVSKGLPIR